VRDGGARDGGGTAGAPTWTRTRDRAEGAPVTVAAGRPWWHHVRVPAFVLAALLLVEVGVRAVEERLSIDVRHINRMDEIVTALVAAPGPSVLFVGNSLTREGVDLELMRAGLAANRAGEWNVAAVYPDDTAVLDWLYLYDRYVVENDAVPDVVVVGFGIWHLEDRPI